MERVIRIGGLFDKPNEKHQAGSIYSIDGLAPNLTTNGGGYHEPLIIVKDEQETNKNSY